MITKLHLKNFKNFRDATLHLGPLTVLVGTNASGKSNLRDAFRFIHGMSRGYNLAEIIGEKYGEGGVLQWKGIRGGVREVAYHGEDRFELRTDLKWHRVTGNKPLGFDDKMSHSIEILVPSEKNPPRVLRESQRSGVYMNFSSHPWDDPPTQEGPEYLFVRLPRNERNRKHGKRLRFLSSQPVLSQFPKHREAQATYRKPVQSHLDQLESMRFLDLSPEAMRIPSIPGQVVLGDRGENLSSVIQAICEDEALKHALAEWINELTPQDVVDFDFVPDQTGRILLTLVESNGQRTSAYSASDGTLRFLAMVAAILGPDAANFYFLEELDTGIHPTRLSLLLQLIEQHARQGKVQVVATTHSPQMLAMLSEKAREDASLVYRLENEPDGRICRIMDIPEARSVLQEHNLARLHESGWLENAVAFAQSEEASV